jgi:hypothetical protein
MIRNNQKFSDYITFNENTVSKPINIPKRQQKADSSCIYRTNSHPSKHTKWHNSPTFSYMPIYSVRNDAKCC